jgi:hypothetical protein
MRLVLLLLTRSSTEHADVSVEMWCKPQNKGVGAALAKATLIAQNTVRAKKIKEEISTRKITLYKLGEEHSKENACGCVELRLQLSEPASKVCERYASAMR